MFTRNFSGPVLATPADLLKQDFFQSDRLPVQIGITSHELVIRVGDAVFAMRPDYFGAAGQSPRQQLKALLRCDDAYDVVQDAIGTEQIQLPKPSRFLSPVGTRQPVFGAGVTVQASVAARNVELTKGDAIRQVQSNRVGTSFYTQAGDPNFPPEIFLKAPEGPGYVHTKKLFIRPDMPVEGLPSISLPEPEITFALTPNGELIALTIGSDTTACSWEINNVLNLLDAKLYAGSTTLHPMLTLFDPQQDLPHIKYKMIIRREDKTIFRNEASSEQFIRPIGDIVAGVMRKAPFDGFANGVFVMSGTGIVPKDIGLEPGDIVIIKSPLGIIKVPVATIEYPIAEAAWTPRTTVNVRIAPAPTKPPFDITDKRVIVTGGAGDIGRAIVERLLRYGARVVIADLDQDIGDTVLSEIKAAIPEAADRVEFVRTDVADQASAVACAEFTNTKWGGIDSLVNCAGVGAAGRVDATPNRAEFDRLMGVNAFGILNMTSAVTPFLRDREVGSRWIVNIESAGSSVGIEDRAYYCASKGAAAAETRASVADLTKFGIGVVGFQPGRVDTQMAQERIAEHEEPEWYKLVMCGSQLTGRMTDRSEIAALVHVVCSGCSANLTGAQIPVDGGWTAVGGQPVPSLELYRAMKAAAGQSAESPPAVGAASSH